jgi:hypothetical protein
VPPLNRWNFWFATPDVSGNHFNGPCGDVVLPTAMDDTRMKAGGYLENSEVLLRVFLESSESHDQPPRKALLRLWNFSHRRH